MTSVAMSSAAELLDAGGIAVITGGASGFGLEAARRCAALGMGIALLDMNDDALASAKAELEELGSADVLTVRCDVSTHEACAEAADAIAAHFGAGTCLRCSEMGVNERGGCRWMRWGLWHGDLHFWMLGQQVQRPVEQL